MQSVAEIGLVQVELEDLILCKRALEAHGEDGLLQLAADRLLRLQEGQASHLLRDGAAALVGAPLDHVVHRGAGDTNHIDAPVVVEPLILDREHRADEVRRHVARAAPAAAVP